MTLADGEVEHFVGSETRAPAKLIELVFSQLSYHDQTQTHVGEIRNCLHVLPVEDFFLLRQN